MTMAQPKVEGCDDLRVLLEESQQRLRMAIDGILEVLNIALRRNLAGDELVQACDAIEDLIIRSNSTYDAVRSLIP